MKEQGNKRHALEEKVIRGEAEKRERAQRDKVKRKTYYNKAAV